MDEERKTSSDTNSEGQTVEDISNPYFYIDPTGDDTLVLARQYQTPDSPKESLDAESLPVSPSAFRFPYQSQPEQPTSSTPTGINRYQKPYQPVLKKSLPTISEDDITDDDETEGYRTPRPSTFVTTTANVPTIQISITAQDITRPVTIYGLPTETLRKILGHVFPIGNTITPWFSCGMSLLHVRGFGINDEHVSFNNNIDAAFLRVSKACHEVGTTLLYSGNRFRFANRSDCATWWLKRIGNANLGKIKMMTVVLNTGWHHDRKDGTLVPAPFEMCHEEYWYRALTHIWARTQLEQLTITTIWWDDPRAEYTNMSDVVELERYRKLVFDRLCSFRGIKKVKIEQIGGQYVGNEAPRLELLMQQPRWTMPRPPLMGKVSLRQAIDYCRRQREEREEFVKEVKLVLERMEKEDEENCGDTCV